MTCRSCSADIDAKAIVCYRCGAPTAGVAARGPAPAARGGGWVWVLVIGLIALAVAGWFAWVGSGM